MVLVHGGGSRFAASEM